MTRSVFDFESEDRVESPERLNEYIRVASPGTWIMVTALFLIVIALVVWGITGNIPSSTAFKGVVDPSLKYTIDVTVDASLFSGQSLVGKEAIITLPDGKNGNGTVTAASTIPYSREELRATLDSDFLVSSLVKGDYSYMLNIQPDIDLSGYGMQIVDVTIITQNNKPIQYLVE